MLAFDPREQPLIAQIWGLEPKNFYEVAKDIVDQGFAGVDINMGCPVRDVVKKGTGSALINNPSLAAEIIAAVKEGTAGQIPVSVKTRIGFDCIITTDWCGFLLSQHLDALTVHGRTTKEQSLVPAHWDEIGKVVELRNELHFDTIIIGNGDVESKDQGEELAIQYGVDGVMIGRGVFKNPWVFNPIQTQKTKAEKILTLLHHLDLREQIYGSNKKLYDPIKRYFKIYLSDFDGAAELREQLMMTKDYGEARKILNSTVIPEE
jgi:tRNA-dihydrouridine synthase